MVETQNIHAKITERALQIYGFFLEGTEETKNGSHK